MQPPNIRRLGLKPYQPIYQQMLKHIECDLGPSIWLLEHHPVYTIGRRSLPSHIRYHNDIPKQTTDRGGQITYHGPGQLIIYPILPLQKIGLSPIQLVDILEDTTIESLAKLNIVSQNDPKARGVYIGIDKVASIGLKIKKSYSYHGIAINIDMDLQPFHAIIPCGNPLQKMTNVSYHTNDYPLFQSIWLHLFLEKVYILRYASVSKGSFTG